MRFKILFEALLKYILRELSRKGKWREERDHIYLEIRINITLFKSTLSSGRDIATGGQEQEMSASHSHPPQDVLPPPGLAKKGCTPQA